MPIRINTAAFLPGAPVSDLDLLAGRIAQLQQLADAISQPGQHAVVYGEFGVGKTSLTAVMREYYEQRAQRTALRVTRVNCGAGDTFSSMWKSVLANFQIGVTEQGMGFVPDVRSHQLSVLNLVQTAQDITAHDIRSALAVLGSGTPVVIFIDEFNRMPQAPVRAQFADMMKLLSDHLSNVTLVLVGVADNISDLIAEHRSIERSLSQIHMPRMTQDEVHQILENGLARALIDIQDVPQPYVTRHGARQAWQYVPMEADQAVLDEMAALTQGLPHYAHLVGSLAVTSAWRDGRRRIERQDMAAAIQRAIAQAQHSVVESYTQAAYSSRKSLYAQVLLACATAAADELGFFTGRAVRERLGVLTGRNYGISEFMSHINALCGDSRGAVLERHGAPRRGRWRFSNPMLQPYVVMRGIDSGALDPTRLSAHRQFAPGAKPHGGSGR